MELLAPQTSQLQNHPQVQLLSQQVQHSLILAFFVNTDTTPEADETIIFTITGVTGGGTNTLTIDSAKAVYTHTITNDDFILANFSSAISNGLEGNSGTTPVTIPVTLSQTSTSAISIAYTVGGTADSTDHTLAFGTLTFLADATTANITFDVNGDATTEQDETVIITLGTVSGDTYAKLGTTSRHTYAITTDDNATVEFASSTGSAPESVAGTINIPINLSQANPTNATTITYTVSGTSDATDHNLTDGTITIPANTTTANISFTVTDDIIVENDETIIITLTGVNSGTSATPSLLGPNVTHTYTITNDESPTVEFASSASSALESAVGSSVYTSIPVKLSQANPTNATTITYTLSGTATESSDYTAAGYDATLDSGTITIAAGATTGNIAFVITDDTTTENDETIIVTLTGVSDGSSGTIAPIIGTTRQHTHTIINDDGSLYSISNSNVIEGRSGTKKMVFTIFRRGILTSGNNEQVRYTVDTTASMAGINDTSTPNFTTSTVNNDVTGVLSGTIDFSGGVAVKTLAFTVNGDYWKENDEQFIVTISAPTGGIIIKAKGIATIKERNLQSMMGIYALRDLNPEKDTPAIRVVRYDFEEQDIGFNDDGSLDTASLLKFVNAPSLQQRHRGYIKTWYDQSYINPVNFTTIYNQPIIVFDGALVLTSTGEPGIEFNLGRSYGKNIGDLGSGDYMEALRPQSDTTVENLEIYLNHQLPQFVSGYPSVISLSGHTDHAGKQMYTTLGRSDVTIWTVDTTATAGAGVLAHPNAASASPYTLNQLNQVVFTANSDNTTAGTAAKNYTDAKQAIFMHGARLTSDNTLVDNSIVVNERWFLMADARNLGPGATHPTGHGILNEAVIYAGDTLHSYDTPSVHGTVGNDVFTYAGENYSQIVGSTGYDTLYVDANSGSTSTGYAIALSDATTATTAKVIGIELIYTFDNNRNDTITLTDAVVDSAEQSTMEIQASSSDRVILPSGYSTDGANHAHNGITTYKLYTKGSRKVYISGGAVTAP